MQQSPRVVMAAAATPPWTATVPDAATWHGIRRFTAGYTPALRDQVAEAGGFGAWFDKQLDGSYDDAWFDQTSTWWTSVNADPATIWARDRAGTESMWWADANYQRWAMVRRFGSQRQVLEAMAEFWEHHLHVPAAGIAGPFRTDYGRTIRSGALGRFCDLLEAAVTHPAMSVYLSNANSTKSAPNENLGRELLELHTVGIGNYGEADVKASARLLTGFKIGLWTDWVASYNPNAHWTGAVTIMGFTHANSAPDGRPALSAYLRHLATHPATARRIARKLAVRFVSDTPSVALVDELAAVYLAHDTDIKPVLRALIASAEFQGSAGMKVRTPSEDVVATYRALGTTLASPATTVGGEPAVNTMLWQSHDIGAKPFDWPRPDGRPDTGVAWASTSRFLASLDVHYTMSGGWWPQRGIAYRTPIAWLPSTTGQSATTGEEFGDAAPDAHPDATSDTPVTPSPRVVAAAPPPKKGKKKKKRRRKKKHKPPMNGIPSSPGTPKPKQPKPPATPPVVPPGTVTALRFDELVDHLSRVVIGQPVEPTMLQAACDAAGCAAAEQITPSHRIIRSEFPRLLTVLLDSPQHMTR